MRNEPAPSVFLVEDGDRIVGVVRSGKILKALSAGPFKAADIAERDYVTVSEHATLFDAVILMRASMASAALVMDETKPAAVAANVKGLVAASQLGDAMIENSRLFLD